MMLTFQVRPSPHTRFTRDDSTGVITDLKRGAYFSVNELGCEIWTAICAGRDWNDVIDDVVRRFDVPEATVRRDVEEFITFLRVEHLLM